MIEQSQLRVRLTGDDDGSIKLAIDNTVRDINRVRTAAEKTASGMSQGMDMARGAVNLLRTGVAAYVAREGYQFWRQSIDIAGAIKDQSTNLGIGVERYQEYGYAATLAGMAVGDIDRNLLRLQRSAAEAAQGTGAARDAFRKLGVSVVDGAGRMRDMDAVLGDVADGMTRINDPMQRTQIVLDIFGRAGIKMVSMLENGSAGLAAMRQEARDTGAVLSESLVREADKAGDELDRLSLVISSNLSRVFVELSPMILAAARGMAALSAEVRPLLGTMGALFEYFGKPVEEQSNLSVLRRELDETLKLRNDLKERLGAERGAVGGFVRDMLGFDEADQATLDMVEKRIDTINKRMLEIGKQAQATLKTPPPPSQGAPMAIGTNWQEWDKESMKRWGETAEQYGKRLAELAREAYPEATMSAEEYGKAEAKNAEAWLKGQEGAEEYGKRMFELARVAYPEATESAEEYGQRMAELSKKSLEAARQGDEVAQIYEDTATSIRGGFRDTFRDILDTGDVSFKSLSRRMLSTFKDMLADMATLAIVRPVIVPIVSAFGGMLGVSGSAQASVLSQLGGGVSAAGGVTALGTLGAGFSAGMQGGFGAANALAGTTTFATSAGAYLGAAAPIAAGALGYYALADMVAGGSNRRRNLSLLLGPGMGLFDRIGGGGLFGTGARTTSRGLELNIAGGDITAREFEDRERKKSFFRGKETWTDFSEADAELVRGLNASVDADTARLVAGARGLGVSAAEGVLDGFASQTRLSLQGKSGQEIQQAIQEWLDGTLGGMAQALLKDTRWAGLLKNASREMVESLFSLGQFFAANPLNDANEMMRVASRTYKQQLDDQRRALLSLNAVYDGSVSATQQLAAAAQDYYQIELAYLQQIAGVRADVSATLGGSIESIRQSVMTPDQLYAHLQARAGGLAGQLGGATDPVRIAEIVREINAVSNQAYGLLPEDARAAFADQFVGFLSGVQNVADQRLNAAQGEVANIHRDLSNTVSATMQDTASRLNDSARSLNDAGDKIKSVMDAVLKSANRYYNYG